MIGRDSSFMMNIRRFPGSAVRRSVYTHTPHTRGHVKIAVTRLDHGHRAAITEPRSVRNQYDLDDESDDDDGEPTTPSVWVKVLLMTVGGG